MKYSISPVNGKTYEIPDDNYNNKALYDFIEANKEKKKIVIQGLGFVGAVMSIVCADSDENYAVIGVDLADERNYWKIGNINDGVFPVIADDPQIKTYFENSKEKNNFFATHDSYVYSLADVIIIDINLDVKKKSIIITSANE